MDLPKYLIGYKDPEKRKKQRREAQTRYRKSEKGKKQRKSISERKAKQRWLAKWRKRNPTRSIAYNKFAYAIKKGSLKKMPCEMCGDLKVHGHHDDYFKPLEVRWLCHYHHSLIHINPRYTEITGRKLITQPKEVFSSLTS